MAVVVVLEDGDPEQPDQKAENGEDADGEFHASPPFFDGSWRLLSDRFFRSLV